MIINGYLHKNKVYISFNEVLANIDAKDLPEKYLSVVYDRVAKRLDGNIKLRFIYTDSDGNVINVLRVRIKVKSQQFLSTGRVLSDRVEKQLGFVLGIDDV